METFSDWIPWKRLLGEKQDRMTIGANVILEVKCSRMANAGYKSTEIVGIFSGGGGGGGTPV